MRELDKRACQTLRLDSPNVYTTFQLHNFPFLLFSVLDALKCSLQVNTVAKRLYTCLPDETDVCLFDTFLRGNAGLSPFHWGST